MVDALTCACFQRLLDLRAAGKPDRTALDELTAILRCTQRDACPLRHDCSDVVRTLIEEVLGD